MKALSILTATFLSSAALAASPAVISGPLTLTCASNADAGHDDALVINLDAGKQTLSIVKGEYTSGVSIRPTLGIYDSFSFDVGVSQTGGWYGSKRYTIEASSYQVLRLNVLDTAKLSFTLTHAPRASDVVAVLHSVAWKSKRSTQAVFAGPLVDDVDYVGTTCTISQP